MRDEIAQKLLEKVKQDYSAIAEEFDNTRQNPWAEFDFLAKYLKQGDKVLDCGCGNARLFGFLKSKNINYTGIDNSEELIKLAREKNPQINFQITDQLSLPLTSNTFDQVWNIAAFHHIPSKKLREKALKEMLRVLKPNGYLVITVWNLWQEKYLWDVLKSMLKNIFLQEYDINDVFIPWGRQKPALRYYHAFTKNEIKELLENAGFKIVEKLLTNNICFICQK